MLVYYVEHLAVKGPVGRSAEINYYHELDLRTVGLGKNSQLLPEEEDMNLEGDSSRGFVKSGPSTCPSLLGEFSLIIPGDDREAS